MPWRDFIYRPPPGVALAMPMVGVKIGFLMTRTSFWFWYEKPVTWASIMTVTLGNMLTVGCLLWMIAVLTRPRFGEWAWRATAIILFLYVASEFTPPFFPGN